MNDDHYKSGGPVFLMIGGEGEINQRYVDGSFLNTYLAQKFGGAAVGVEHRFYGERFISHWEVFSCLCCYKLIMDNLSKF